MLDNRATSLKSRLPDNSQKHLLKVKVDLERYQALAHISMKR